MHGNKVKIKLSNIKTIDLKSSKEISQIVNKVIRLQAEAISNLNTLIDKEFTSAIQLIHESKGRLIVTGIGKSANIANKIVATLNSTGQPAIFMHAADAIHGDLGMILQDDIVLCISKSGNTPEIKVLVPLIKNNGNPLIAMTSNKSSYLADQSDYVFHAFAEKEACPNNLAPTTSTTVQLVLGDAMAVALLEMKDFTAEDFAKYHPGGSLGKKLYLRVEDLIHENKPEVSLDATISQVIVEISSKRLGATVVCDKGSVVGLVTDGDLRRMLENDMNFSGAKAKTIMTKDPYIVPKGTLVANALSTMETKNITQLIIVDNGVYIGLIHLNDILKEGIL